MKSALVNIIRRNVQTYLTNRLRNRTKSKIRTMPKRRRRRGGFGRRKFRRKRFRRRTYFRRPENKLADQSNNDSVSVSFPKTHLLFDVSEATGVNSRIGRKITIESLVIRGLLQMSATPNAPHEMVRMAIVQDKQQVSDTDPGAASVWENSADPQSFREHTLQGRFKILAQRTYLLHSVAGGQGSDAFRFRLALRFPRGLPVQYNGASVTDIQKNGLYFIYQSDAADAFPMNMDWNTRVRFTDV